MCVCENAELYIDFKPTNEVFRTHIFRHQQKYARNEALFFFNTPVLVELGGFYIWGGGKFLHLWAPVPAKLRPKDVGRSRLRPLQSAWSGKPG